MEKPGARCLLEEGINNVVLIWVLLKEPEKRIWAQVIYWEIIPRSRILHEAEWGAQSVRLG